MQHKSSVSVIVQGMPPKDLGLAKADIVRAAHYFAQRSCTRMARVTGRAVCWHEVVVHLIRDAASDELHRAIMGIAGATDVITQAYDAIPPEEPGLYGELFVNVDQARRAAPHRHGWSAAKELLLYIAHGMDHLSGADDYAPADYARMRRRELGWLKAWRGGVLAVMLSFAWLGCGEPGATLVDNGRFEKITAARQATRWRIPREGWYTLMGAGVKGSRALVYENDDAGFASAPSQMVEFEKGYAYVVDADVKIDAALQGTAGGGAYVMAEWLDANGEVVAHVRTQPIAAITEGWRHVEAISKPVPASAVRCRVSFGVTRGCVGRVAFDNVRFARWYTPRLQGLSTTARDNQAAEGLIDVVAALNDADADLAAYTAYFCWRGADGQTHTVPPTQRDATRAQITLNVRDLALGPSQIAFVLLRPTGEIDARREITFTRTR